MMKKFILALATISLLATLPACTSKDSKNEDVIAEDDAAAEGMADDAGAENLDESLDSEQPSEQMAQTTENPDASASVAETATDDQLTIDSFGEGTEPTTTTAENVPDASMPEADPLPPASSEPAANDLAMEPAPPTTTGAEEMAPPADDLSSAQNMASTETNLDDDPKPAPKSLQKMASSPWKMGNKWVNGIYFARPGDSLSSISQTIYGDNRSKELKKINPTYNNRDVKPGDKVYYSSVVRPEDNGQILTYFEEKNIPAKTYVSKPGDNIRKVSQDLLGYPEAWKEVWAYNTVESKQDIGEGVELRYWEAQAHMGSPSAPMADQSSPQAPPSMPSMPDQMAQVPPPPPPTEELPPPPDMSGQNMAANDLPPPPPPMEPPPPPPSMDMAPPPPPPPPPPVAQNQAGMEDTGAPAEQQDQTLAMGAIAVAVLGALALIMVRRKRKQREMDQALGETHVG